MTLRGKVARWVRESVIEARSGDAMPRNILCSCLCSVRIFDICSLLFALVGYNAMLVKQKTESLSKANASIQDPFQFG